MPTTREASTTGCAARFGDKWGARVSWYYWINFPLWIASLAMLFPSTLGCSWQV